MSLKRSIRLRLGLAAALTIIAALAVGGIVLSALFDRQVNRLAEVDLAERSLILISALRPDNVLPGEPADTIGGDPRYLRPYSGYYWQIEMAGRIHRSQSLWDTVLPLGPAPPAGTLQISSGSGPDGQTLKILERMIVIGGIDLPVRVVVALSSRNFTEAQTLFARDLVPFLAVLGALLILASLIQIMIGLRPLRRIRQQVVELGRYGYHRLGRDMPPEVEPLAREIDSLLDDRDARIEKARHRAADLAHTLKTPLQALMGEAGRLHASGQGLAANAITDIVDTLRQRVDHELGRERIAGQGRSDPKTIAQGVVNVLRRTVRGDEIAITLNVAPTTLEIDPQDLAEVIGSLAENALRHARSRIAIRSEPMGAMMALIVEDDGLGIPVAQIDRVTDRGVRLTKNPDGNGLGLALVRDIVEAHQGHLSFENLATGLRVTAAFPVATEGRVQL